jgi:hypothetical protein
VRTLATAVLKPWGYEMGDYTVELICTVTDPAERRRRLARAYDILLQVTRQEQQHTDSRQSETIDSVTLAGDETSDTER